MGKLSLCVLWCVPCVVMAGPNDRHFNVTGQDLIWCWNNETDKEWTLAQVTNDFGDTDVKIKWVLYQKDWNGTAQIADTDVDTIGFHDLVTSGLWIDANASLGGDYQLVCFVWAGTDELWDSVLELYGDLDADMFQGDWETNNGEAWHYYDWEDGYDPMSFSVFKCDYGE